MHVGTFELAGASPRYRAILDRGGADGMAEAVINVMSPPCRHLRQMVDADITDQARVVLYVSVRRSEPTTSRP